MAAKTKFVKYEDVKATRLAAMTPEERAVYDEAYEQAGVALRLAELFYETRAAAGLSQTELARRMGTSQPVIARIEGGGSTPTVDMLDRLARATGKRLEITLAEAS
jgi:ribosome-binding protein aMBF1 (putative translation factor)